VIEEHRLDVEGLLLLDGGSGKLVVWPKAFAGHTGQNQEAGGEE